MGCCESNYIIESTKNEVENNIRNAIINLELNNRLISEFESIFVTIMKIPIEEVKDSKIYTNENFHKLINTTIINNKSEKELIVQQYNIILKPGSEKKFHFFFFLQILFLVKGSFNEKLKFFFLLTKSHLTPFTVKQMKVFIYQYFEVNFIKVTKLFVEGMKLNSEIDSLKLLKDVFNENNIRAYSKVFIKEIDKYILKSKPLLKNNSAEIDDEILKDEDVSEYFVENKILFDAIELRKDFYNRFNVEDKKITSI